jgi:hypothetical protein
MSRVEVTFMGIPLSQECVAITLSKMHAEERLATEARIAARRRAECDGDEKAA